MICKYCGADYDKTKIKCPFCQSENAALAKKIKKDILKSYDKEAKEMEVTVPKQAVKKWTSWLVKILPAIIIIAVAATVIAIIWGRVSADKEYKTEQKHLAEMEELFLEEDWEALEEYFGDHDISYGGKVQKYSEVCSAYSYFELFLGEVEELEGLEEVSFSTPEQKEELYYGWIELALSNAGRMLSWCRSYTDDTVFRGNEKELEKLYNECVGILLVFGYSEEEIEWIAEGEDSEYFENLKEKMYAYYMAE